MSHLFDTPSPTLVIERDRWDRPLVVPPDGGTPVPYKRCTRFVDVLEDKFNLQQWELRQVALGLADRPDLLLSVAAHRDDKTVLNGLVRQAKEAAKASAPATTGTALHALCERADRGQHIGLLPTTAQADLDAYLAETRCFEHVAIERFTVHDELRIGGTPDRVVKIGGEYFIADIKTGSIEWGALKIAMQLAVYAHSQPYNPATREREPYPFEVDDQQAIVIHLPAGQASCTLHHIDINAGWCAVRTAGYVRDWRAKKDWYTPFPAPDHTPPAAALSTVGDQLAAATTVDELRNVWVSAIAAGTWTEADVTYAQQRRAQIEQVAS